MANIEQEMQYVEEEEEEDVLESQPLAEELWDTPVPENFKIPSLPSFDGKTDPLEHLMEVGMQMALIGAEEPLKCKLLSGTFKDIALRWYMNLPNHSVTGYTDFHKKLMYQFSGSKHVQVTATALFGISQ
ncbi:hypothetical protein A2U01_0054223, partial [Trifolium medium]|nr:hypothetical protein [Trifolium medium]